MFRIAFFFTLVFLFQVSLLKAQVEQNLNLPPFKIEGQINADTGTISLQTLFYAEYFPEDIKSLNSVVENGKFTFQGKIPYSQACHLEYEEKYHSDIPVIEPGTRSLTVNIDSTREIPLPDNQVMNQYFVVISYCSIFEYGNSVY